MIFSISVFPTHTLHHYYPLPLIWNPDLRLLPRGSVTCLIAHWAVGCPISPLCSFLQYWFLLWLLHLLQPPPAPTQVTAKSFCGPQHHGHGFSVVPALAPLLPHPIQYFPLLLIVCPWHTCFTIAISSWQFLFTYGFSQYTDTSRFFKKLF